MEMEMREYEKMMMMMDKGKGIAVQTKLNSGEDDNEDDYNISNSLPSAKASPRHASSKYDFVKVSFSLLKIHSDKSNSK